MDDLTLAVLAQPITKKSRLPRYKRAPHPPRMELTGRDREILRQVYSYRLMTREQIERLLFAPEQGQDHFTKTSKARLRLKLLFHHGYLERIAIPVNLGSWAWRPVYRLSRKGADLVASEMGTDLSQLAYWGKGDDQDHRTSQPSFLFLNHALAINDVRIAFTRAAKRKGYQVEKWLDEAQLKGQEFKDYVTVRNEQSHSAKIAVIPDAYFILHLGDRRAHFLLELDRATMSNTRWKTRILAYQEYVRTGKYQVRYQTKSLRILTVTTTRQRLENLKKTTERAGGKDTFWFTPLADVLAQDVLSSPIWRLASHETDESYKSLIS